MPKFIVETLQTFREVHIVEAENREDAEKIAQNSDYNASYFLGSQVLDTKPFTVDELLRYKDNDQYFWEGIKSVNADGFLVYTTEHGPRVTDEKIF
jgi:hypothetical protein